MRSIKTRCVKHLLLLVFLLFPLSFAFASGTTNVQRGDRVVLIEPMSDGVTYYVQTPIGLEIWKDRDSYHFAGYQEQCTVIKSYGSEVLLYVPIMNAKYWFSVEQTNLR